MEAKRAKAGQGVLTLKGVARSLAEDLDHELGNFRSKGNGVHQARCQFCLAAAIVDQREWEKDGLGVGGSATKSTCVRNPIRAMEEKQP